MPVVPALGRLRQDYRKYEVSLFLKTKPNRKSEEKDSD